MESLPENIDSRRGGHRSVFKTKGDSENCSEGKGKLRFRISMTLLKTLAGRRARQKGAIGVT